ncbi:MAG: helix-turn-helix transcriptional regulator, partial [Bacteroidales bacterium]|nr:helix-turn-helix transcriptional regulator [Bacteroidales bacterium]
MSLFAWMITFFKKFLGKGRNDVPPQWEGYTPDKWRGVAECKVELVEAADKLDLLSYRVDEVMRLKQLYLNSNLTLEMLAQEMGTNRTYLSRMFNWKKKMSFIAYLNG